MKNDTPADRLLRAARALFAAHGYSGTSIRGITARAHTNLGAVTYHFGTKRDLYHAVLDAVVAPLIDRVRLAAAQPGPPLARIEGIIRVYFGHLSEQPDMPPRLLHPLTPGGPELARFGSPAPGVPLCRRGLEEADSASFFIRLLGGQIAVDRSGLALGPPIRLARGDDLIVFPLHPVALLPAFPSFVQPRGRGGELLFVSSAAR